MTGKGSFKPMIDQLELNEYGFYWLRDKPNKSELEKYYKERYYQEEKGSYSFTYSDAELEYFNNKIEQKYFVIKELVHSEQPSIIDFGCGEGFTLNFFLEQNWDVTGLDYSDYGCRHFNPHCLPFFITGDIYAEAEKLVSQGKKFDVVWLKHVLEHVLDPFEALSVCKKLVKDDGIVVVEVPNDFSVIQNSLLQNDKIDKPFWIAVPDHISYFNKTGLVSLAVSAGLKLERMIADFPIDFALFNPLTNYVLDKNAGKAVHMARVEIENLLHGISVEKVNRYYEALADLGVGREIIGFFRVA